MNRIKYIITGQSMIMYYNTTTQTLSKKDPKFKKVMGMITKGQEQKVIDFIFPDETVVEKYTMGIFTIKNGLVYIKNEAEPVNSVIAHKLKRFFNEGLPVKPLINFQKNLNKNPSESSRNQLFRCLEHNHHPITEDGMFVAYKYISINEKGNFVDSYTGKFNNNIGKTVSIDREDVDANPDQSCSHGLHVASFEYTQGEQTIVQVLVNPKDVVAVPNDYNNQKMRVCKYKVIGIGKVELKEEFLPKITINKNMMKAFKRKNGFVFSEMSDKEIRSLVKNVTGKTIRVGGKDKRPVVQKAEEIMMKAGYMKSNQCINIYNMTAKAIVEYIKAVTGTKITLSIKSKKAILKRALVLLEGV